jgi:hypothetical protein
MSDSFLGKMVASVIILLAFIFWLVVSPDKHPDCRKDCPTDFSASRK